jgi:hypothetical protein
MNKFKFLHLKFSCWIVELVRWLRHGTKHSFFKDLFGQQKT